MVAVAYHASHFETSVASFVYISKESWLRQNTELNLYSELWIALALAAPSCGLKKSWINTMLALSSDGIENACISGINPLSPAQAHCQPKPWTY